PDRAPPPQEAAFQCCNAGRIISAIFKPLQRIQNRCNDWTLTHDTDNSTHVLLRLLRTTRYRLMRRLRREGHEGTLRWNVTMHRLLPTRRSKAFQAPKPWKHAYPANGRSRLLVGSYGRRISLIAGMREAISSSAHQDRGHVLHAGFRVRSGRCRRI